MKENIGTEDIITVDDDVSFIFRLGDEMNER